MTSIKQALLYGFLVWLISFIVACFIFCIHDSNRPLFESVMAVAVVGTTAFLAKHYFKKVSANFLREGILLGLIWFAIAVAIDLIMFMPPTPMQTSFSEYLSDIGITYLVIPIITIGMGKVLHIHLNRSTTEKPSSPQ